MIKNFTILLLLCCIIAQSMMLAQNDPFRRNEGDKHKNKQIPYPDFLQRFFKEISRLQRSINKTFTQLARDIKEKRSITPVVLIIIFSFLFGVIHALGPGHGKTITFSYFLSKRADIKKGILVGNIIGILHALSAIIVVLLLYYIIKHSYQRSLTDVSRIIQIVSYSAVIMIGLYLLVTVIVKLIKKSDKHKEPSRSIAIKNIFLFAISIGIIPCPGAMIIMLFSISTDLIIIGTIAALVMGLGMATTVSVVGILTIVTKKCILRLTARRTGFDVILQNILSIVGALFVLLSGILLLTSSI